MNAPTTNANPKAILITGATGGIGGALAIAYAANGITLYLQGRDQAKLASLQARCEALGARVEVAALDVTNRVALDEWLGKLCQTTPPDLVIPAAGINISAMGNAVSDDAAQGGSHFVGEKWAEVDALIEINIRAVMATVDHVLPIMRARGHGQIALFSSLAAYYGLPVTPSYCASKAAIKAYGEALRGGLAGQGIWVNVIMPGFVESYMCNEMAGPKPFMWSPEKAAIAIKAGLKNNHARISFPFPLNLGCWFLAVLPAAVSARLVKWFDYSA